MGISIDGGMIVGCLAGDLPDIPEEFEEMDVYDYWRDECCFDCMPPWYDADWDDCIVGFGIDDVKVEDIQGKWLAEVVKKGSAFKALTGIEPRLYGVQSVW